MLFIRQVGIYYRRKDDASTDNNKIEKSDIQDMTEQSLFQAQSKFDNARSIDEYFDQQTADNNTLDYSSQAIVQDTFDQWDQKSTELVDVECRSDVCRIEVVHHDAETEQSSPKALASKIVNNFNEVMVVDKDKKENGAPVVMYIARGDGLFDNK